MDNLSKFILGGLALFLALGGPRLFKNDDNEKSATQKVQPAEKTKDTPGQADALLVLPETKPEKTFSNQPNNQIFSLEWLEKNGSKFKNSKKVRLTYYLLANSQRCHPDSLSSCMRENINEKEIGSQDFQLTYFLDRVMLAGSGVLSWQDQRYVTNYVRLREAGWNSGDHSGKNNYTCRRFKFQDKKGVAFIKQNIDNKSTFTIWQDHQYPNGRTFSGQEAVNWQTVSVNLNDFPLSVPDKANRDRLTAKLKTKNIAGPFTRSFLVLKTEDGKQFLTEVMDTGAGVKQGWVDWRIGNSSDQINYFINLGSAVEATCYTFDDPSMTIEKILGKSNTLTAK